MKHIIKVFMDLIYLYPLKLRKFKQILPEDTIIAYGACKGVKLDSEEEITRGPQWIFSKRGFFIFSDNRIVLGDWEIDLIEIEKAELMKYGSGMVLKLKLKNGENYHLGLKYIRELLDQNCLDIVEIDCKVRYSLFSKVIRVIAVVYLLYIILLQLI